MARKSKEQLQREKQNKSVNKHVKEHYRRLELRFHNERQQHIIEFLESKPNKQQYITSLILADMEKENK